MGDGGGVGWSGMERWGAGQSRPVGREGQGQPGMLRPRFPAGIVSAQPEGAARLLSGTRVISQSSFHSSAARKSLLNLNRCLTAPGHEFPERRLPCAVPERGRPLGTPLIPTQAVTASPSQNPSAGTGRQEKFYLRKVFQ